MFNLPGNRVLAVFLTSLAVCAQEPVSWKDPSKRQVRFVTVEEGVRLEALDWGGSGRAVVLLTGFGNSAHVYDDFAVKLSDCCHVYAIMRRGFGLSSHPESGYTDQRRADDVFQVIEALKIDRPVLVGHSMAGSELTTVGVRHSDRLSGLVYLEAGADPKDFPWSDAEYLDKVKFAFCESEVRNMYDSNPDGSIGAFMTRSGPLGNRRGLEETGLHGNSGAGVCHLLDAGAGRRSSERASTQRPGGTSVSRAEDRDGDGLDPPVRKAPPQRRARCAHSRSARGRPLLVLHQGAGGARRTARVFGAFELTGSSPR
jgi:pimeloyl-ACP methyl ester carboxylesterase